MLNPYITRVTLRFITVIVILIAAFYFFQFVIPLIYPFIIGWLIAMMIEPIVNRLERNRIPRWLSVTFILILLLSLVFSFIFFLVAELVVELTHLAERLPSLFNQFSQIFVDTFTKENNNISKLIDTLQSYLQKNPQHQQQITHSIQENIGVIAKGGTQFITDILAKLGAFLGNLPYLLTVVVFITLAAFFIGLDWPRFRNKLSEITPQRLKSTSGLVLNDLKRALFGFIRAQLTLISITALLMFIGLVILRVPYAFTIAFAIGLVDLLPYLGVGAVVIPWAIYLFLIGNIELAIGLTIVYGIIVIVRQVIEPKLVATNVGLDPLLTLIALFAGLQLFGFLGLIIGPVAAVILIALHRANVLQDTWRFIVSPRAD